MTEQLQRNAIIVIYLFMDIIYVLFVCRIISLVIHREVNKYIIVYTFKKFVLYSEKFLQKSIESVFVNIYSFYKL